MTINIVNLLIYLALYIRILYYNFNGNSNLEVDISYIKKSELTDSRNETCSSQIQFRFGFTSAI